jgi:cell division protein FtsB
MRVVNVILIIVLVLLQFRLWLSDDGVREFWQLRGQVVERTEENRALARRNAALEAEVNDLKEGLEAIEERARTELGMIRNGETFYQIVPVVPE